MAGPSLLLLVVVVVVAVVTWRLVSTDDESDEPYRAPTPTGTPAGVEAGGAAQALQQLARAVTEGDRGAASALAAPDDEGSATRLGDVVDGATAARLSDVTFRYVDEEGGVAADGTWPAAVDVTWQYAGFDRTPSTAEVQVRFRAGSGDGGVTIAGLGGGSLQTPVWLSGPLQVSRSRDLLVVVAGGQDAEPYVRLAEAAVPDVADVVTTWRPRLVVEVPSDGAALEAALGVEPGYYGQIAAVTGSGEATITAESPIHVFVNPDVFDGLGRVGQEVVLAHEATHVATDAPLSEAPTWLVEGFADYVALRDTTLPLSRTAGQIEDRVRREGPPDALPGADEFDTRGPHLGAVYEASWLVCVTLADRGTDAALERFYTAVSDGAAVADELDRRFDWTEADLVEAWQARLAELPRERS